MDELFNQFKTTQSFNDFLKPLKKDLCIDLAIKYFSIDKKDIKSLKVEECKTFLTLLYSKYLSKDHKEPIKSHKKILIDDSDDINDQDKEEKKMNIKGGSNKKSSKSSKKKEKKEEKDEDYDDNYDEYEDYKIENDEKVGLYSLKNNIKFYAGGSLPYHNLSNFAQINGGFVVDGLVFPSSEHAFQSFKYIPEDRKRFTINGDLGNIEAFSLFFHKEIVEKKKNYWMAKNNIGILAKMATSKENTYKLGLHKDSSFKSTDELWFKILKKKFEPNVFPIPLKDDSKGKKKEKLLSFKDILCSTKGSYLLEFSRSARRLTLDGKPPYWNGLIDEDGKLYGINKMGYYLMQIRDMIC